MSQPNDNSIIIPIDYHWLLIPLFLKLLDTYKDFKKTNQKATKLLHTLRLDALALLRVIMSNMQSNIGVNCHMSMTELDVVSIRSD